LFIHGVVFREKETTKKLPGPSARISARPSNAPGGGESGGIETTRPRSVKGKNG
jgi:hypothetical protein